MCLSFLLNDKLFYCAPLLILYLYCLSQNLISIKYTKNNFKFSSTSWLVSKQNYEWISGMKEDGGRLLVLTILFLAISLLSKQVLVFSVYIFVLLLIATRFYSHSEPFNMLELRGLHYRTVIRKTCILHFKDYSKIVLPLFIIQTVLFYNKPLFIYSISTLICSYILILYFVINKYDQFEPNTTSHLKNLKNLLLAFSALIPFLIIIPIGLMIKNFPSKNSEVNVTN